MPEFSNNPVVSLSTRTWLNQLASRNEILDQPSLELILPALNNVKAVHPGDLVFGLARNLGASVHLALLAGSVSELFNAACSLIDDLQDDDTDAYMANIPMPLRLNAQVHLLSLVSSRGAELTALLSTHEGSEIVVGLHQTLAAMLVGQRLEIAKDKWDMSCYEKVARLTAGEQFGAYARLAAIAASVEPTGYEKWGCAIGNLVQLIADVESVDPRFLSLPSPDREKLGNKFLQELDNISIQCQNAFLNEQYRMLQDRWQTCGNKD